MTIASRLFRIRDLPIRRKLRLISGLTTAIALTLAGIGMLLADSFLSYQYLKADLASFVEVIGNNSSGALAFDDPKVASETLSALRSRSHVQIACLFQKSGAVLASFVRPGFSGKCPAPSKEPVRTAGRVLIASQEIQLEGRSFGTLVLQYDLDEIFERVSVYAAIVLGALLLSYLLTFAVSSRLRGLISGPILELAGVAHAVTSTTDYSIRAPKTSEDEIGLLSDALNTMMQAVQLRDDQLRRALAQQKTANDQLAAVNTELQRSNTDLERFAFMASHDLQEPLRMITAYSQLLVARRDNGDKSQLEEFTKYIAAGTARMRELLSDLLDYSEIAGSADRPPEIVDLNTVINDALELMKARLCETGTEVRVDRMPALWAHQNRVSSLFVNLIDNAIKYRSDSAPRIRISVEPGSEELTFSVADNGIGIAEEYQAKIFIAFQRLHGKEIPGTGIGLAICKRVIERYGGRIWVQSERGEGTTFYFTLPLSMAASNLKANERYN